VRMPLPLETPHQQARLCLAKGWLLLLLLMVRVGGCQTLMVPHPCRCCWLRQAPAHLLQPVHSAQALAMQLLEVGMAVLVQGLALSPVQWKLGGV
jgi:hypothetical protein